MAKTRRVSAASQGSGDPSGGQEVQKKPLSELHLDRDNPRFGDDTSQSIPEIEVLDKIVRDYGVQDVLSSIARNGYFRTEPLVAVQANDGDPIIVVEGNRRLSACLILTGDKRAINQTRLRDQHAGEKGTKLTTVPVLIFRNRREILPYLGVRHIAGSMTWDGYAKAKWIAQVLEEQESLTLSDITKMIGDLNNTAPRLLEGYYFISQLIREDRFQPSNSQVPGRGSNPNYPFSWIYTILGYAKAREWMGIETSGRLAPDKAPVPKAKLEHAEKVVCYMFGDKQQGRRPVLTDSRQLIKLARALDRPEVVTLLDDGVSLDQALEESRSAEDKAEEGLTRAVRTLAQVQSSLGSGKISQEKARTLEPVAAEARKRSIDMHKSLVFTMITEESDKDNG